MARERFREVVIKKKGEPIQLIVDLKGFPHYADIIEFGAAPGGYGVLHLRIECDKGKEIEALDSMIRWVSRDIASHIDPEDYPEEKPKEPDIVG